jgi:hypothetical protein
MLDGHPDPALDHLHGRGKIFPHEKGTQHRMVVHDPLPGSLECRNIQFAAQRSDGLVEIGSGIRLGETVVKQALLQR